MGQIKLLLNILLDEFFILFAFEVECHHIVWDIYLIGCKFIIDLAVDISLRHFGQYATIWIETHNGFELYTTIKKIKLPSRPEETTKLITNDELPITNKKNTKISH